ncbi:MAG: DUF3416 domain-containing protein [candidate division Zixibacteria bacterium]|nr:DUF3416 domain-containing protein [candidate division Zixibacteria bacterium]
MVLPPARVIIEHVDPEIDAGRFPIKRVVGESVTVEADIYAEGHDVLDGVLLYRHESESDWHESRLEPLVNDRWRALFVVTELGRYHYSLEAWIDYFLTWRRDLRKRIDAGQDVTVELLRGAQYVEAAIERAQSTDANLLRTVAMTMHSKESVREATELVLGDEVLRVMRDAADRSAAVRYERELAVTVNRKKARFSTWYEMFPRSTSDSPGQHGTFADCEKRLPYLAEMGFDILYLPPIHPIGTTNRKGANNAVECRSDDPGSPWAIGSSDGGHKSVHPELGTLDDFRHLVDAAESYGIDIALDIAFQCSPDHPYVKEHPEWFIQRPDGTIQYAENPPKKYEDIYPINFDTPAWEGLWAELRDIFEFWIQHGVRIFRVDNPHTKPFSFWEWLIGEIRKSYPDVIFLSEAFTRPKIMYQLAKLGFDQSYTYFAWRNTRHELREYATELTQTKVREFFGSNFWPNTPDILTEYMQWGGRPAFQIRHALAATLSSNYGIYGPAYELSVNEPLAPGREDYLNSEKYEIKHWNLDAPESLRPFIGRINQIRNENPALHSNWHLDFHDTDNDQILCYSKRTDDFSNIILVFVVLDCFHPHSGWSNLNLDALGIEPDQTFQAHDLMTGARYMWQGSHNFISLHPSDQPAHIFRLRRRVRSERDFEYFL